MTDFGTDLQNKHALAMHVAGLGLGTVDYRSDTIALDQRAAAIFDLPADTFVPRSTLHDRICIEDRPKIDYQVERLLDPDDDDYIDVQHRVTHRDGTIRWVSARKQVDFVNEDGRMVPVSGLVAIMDITEHKDAQQHIRDLLEEQAHRSKNLLTVVLGLARRTLSSGPVDTFEVRFSDRLNGLVHNIDALARDTWKHANLKKLARSHLAAFAGRSLSRVTLSGADVGFDPQKAQAIGMAFHELATNAVKYGALSTAGGRVEIAWGPQDDDSFEITWREVGGPEVQEPERVGFGQSVITDMAEAAVFGTAHIDYRPDGVVWTLRMPMSSVDKGHVAT